MAIDLPVIEDSELTHYIPPKGEYITFENEEDYEEMGRSWGLFGKNPKHEFWYKDIGYKRSVKVVGYELTNSFYALVIEFKDGNLCCIHPDYLKEMQKSTFGKETDEEPKKREVLPKEEKLSAPAATKPKVNLASKEKNNPIELPTDKVDFEAMIKGIDTKPNPFSDKDDEILLLESVTIIGDNETSIGLAWCGYSKTLKKSELKEGQKIGFTAKVVKKKHKEYTYKINNPSKIEKLS